MKITDVRASCYRIPLEQPLTDAGHGRHDHYDLVTVELGAEGGHTGLGYTYTVHAGGAAILALIEHDLTPLLLGADTRRIDALWRDMWQRTLYVGRGGIAAFAIAALDIALWDLRGRVLGEPLWRLLGGAADRVPAYVGGIDLLLPLDQLLEQTRAALGDGFGAIKMKVGRDRLAEDVERVAAMRELLGPEAALMVDANMRWTVGPGDLGGARASGESWRRSESTGWKSRSPPTTTPATAGSPPRARCPWPPARACAALASSRT